MANQESGNWVPPTFAPNAKPPEKKAGLLGHLSTWQKIQTAGVVVLAIGAAGYAAVLHFKAQANIVLFENSLEQAGELALNGKSYGTIEPHKHLRLEVETGTVNVTFSAGGTKLDEGTFTATGSKGGLGDIGYRGVYNIGGKKGLAIVTKYYGGSQKDYVNLIPEGKRSVDTPYVELAKVDDGFPASVTVRKGQSFGVVTRVCHVDEEKQTVGCPGW
jgi:hypothetical protein